MLVSAFASALAIGAAQPAQDGAALATQPAAAPTEGVIAYPPEFFAASQPTTALDMLSRLPGFAVDTGDTVRGFEGAAGNVLLDGQRPATKTDNLEEILRRVPASQVARIDLIRGGAPGIDMQGKSVLANVIRKPGGGFQGVAAVSGRAVYDGRQTLTGRVELSGGDGSRAWEASATYGKGIDDGSGEGPGVRVAPDGTVLRRADIDEEGDTVQTTLTGSYAMPLLGPGIRFGRREFGQAGDRGRRQLHSRSRRAHIDGADRHPPGRAARHFLGVAFPVAHLGLRPRPQDQRDHRPGGLQAPAERTSVA